MSAAILQIEPQTIAPFSVIPQLVNYNLMPQMLSEIVIDQAIASIQCTLEEATQACQEFYQQRGLDTSEKQDLWRSHYHLSPVDIEVLATRKLRVEKFKQITWGHKLDSHFLKRKHQLDRVIYSMIRVKDREIASELYFRISEGEQSFAVLAAEYSEGSEAHTNGLVGPVDCGSLAPNLATLLQNRSIGVVQAPVRLGEWYVIVRVEKLIPAQLNDFMRQRLLQENFEAWFQDQVRQLSPHDQIWMGVKPAQLS